MQRKLLIYMCENKVRTTVRCGSCLHMPQRQFPSNRIIPEQVKPAKDFLFLQ